MDLILRLVMLGVLIAAAIACYAMSYSQAAVIFLILGGGLETAFWLGLFTLCCGDKNKRSAVG